MTQSRDLWKWAALLCSWRQPLGKAWSHGLLGPCPHVHFLLLSKSIPRWSHWPWKEVAEDSAIAHLSPDCSIVLWVSDAFPLEVIVKYVQEFGKQNELFQSSHQKFKAFNLSPKVLPHFASNWKFQNGCHSQWICAEEELDTKQIGLRKGKQAVYA